MHFLLRHGRLLRSLLVYWLDDGADFGESSDLIYHRPREAALLKHIDKNVDITLWHYFEGIWQSNGGLWQHMWW